MAGTCEDSLYTSREINGHKDHYCKFDEDHQGQHECATSGCNLTWN